jgi:hypothetical protein
MKNFIKENWFKLLITLFGLVLLIGIFYWFEYRPKHIIKECFSITSNSIYGKFLMETDVEKFNILFKNCLRGNGLEI